MPTHTPYPAYRPTDLPWLAQIPAHWDVERIKFNSYVKGRIGWQNLRSDEFTTEGPYLITGMHFKDGGIDWDACFHITEERYQMAPEIQVRDGDLLITKDGSIGKLAYIDKLPDKASLNSHLLVIRPLKNRYETKFLFHLLNSSLFRQYVLETQTGTTFFGITQESIESFPILLPPLPEQRAIAAFLDLQTAKVDALIAKKQHLLDLLAEQRSILISHITTKGLQASVTKKKTDFPEIGSIPIHWSTTKLGFLSNIFTGTTPSTNRPEYYEGDVPFVKTADIVNNSIQEPTVFISQQAVADYSLKIFPKNTVLLAMYGQGKTRGQVSLLAIPAAITQNAAAIVSNRHLLPRFLWYFLQGQYNRLRGLGIHGHISHLNLDYVKNLRICLPSITEQKQIIEFLDQKMGQLDTLVTKIETAIARLREYRAALISAAVTGKFDFSAGG